MKATLSDSNNSTTKESESQSYIDPLFSSFYMEKMDLEDWELLPHDDGGKMILSRKDFNMNYFICPSPEHPQIVPFPIQLEPSFQETTNDHEEVITKENNILPSKYICDNSMMEADQDQDQVDADPFQFEEQAQVVEVDKEMVINKMGMEAENSGGINLLNKSLNGIGAIFSFGVAAAATICIIFVGNHQNNKQNQHKLRFQIFSDDKRMKQVVEHATKLNEAIAAVRGVPVTRAHITVGGYYDGL